MDTDKHRRNDAQNSKHLACVGFSIKVAGAVWNPNDSLGDRIRGHDLIAAPNNSS